jgi:hypothetical protein
MVKIDLPEHLVRDARERFQVTSDQRAVVAALELAVRTDETAEERGRERGRSGPICRHCDLVIEDAPQWCPELDEGFCVP